MTNEDMRKAIAAHLGWKLYQINFAMRSWVALREPGFDPTKLADGANAFEVEWKATEYLPFAWDDVPNWPEDLNACVEFEEVLVGRSGRPLYLDHLCAIVCDSEAKKWEREWFAVTAKAPQRCEAFLRTIDKWRDA